jgi:hypothetical protein
MIATNMQPCQRGTPVMARSSVLNLLTNVLMCIPIIVCQLFWIMFLNNPLQALDGFMTASSEHIGDMPRSGIIETILS